jgi:hypothetical protein
MMAHDMLRHRSRISVDTPRPSPSHPVVDTIWSQRDHQFRDCDEATFPARSLRCQAVDFHDAYRCGSALNRSRHDFEQK